jgi:hypothetical protein
MFANLRILARVICLLLGLAPMARASVLAIDYDTGSFYSVNTSDASLTLINETYVKNLGSLEYSNGSFYAIRTGGSEAALFEISTDGSSVSQVGSGLGAGYYFEGSLVFSPSGAAYATNRGTSSTPQLMTVSPVSGQAFLVGTMSGGSHDINGMAWRSDGMIVGLDRVTNALVEINPQTADVQVLASLSDDLVGGVGGMAYDGFNAYLATAGPGGTRSGSNSLYSVDLYTGAVSSIGVFNIGGAPLTGSGIGGLAFDTEIIIPEPTALMMIVLGSLGLLRRRRAI